MGLGPPVCIKCETIMDFHQDYKETKRNPWYCKVCGDIPQSQISNLWLYPKEKIIKMELESYGYEITYAPIEEIRKRNEDWVKEISFDFIKSEFSSELLDTWFNTLHKEINWAQKEITFYGKQIKIPRLQQWHGDEDAFYSYSGMNLKPLPWTPTLLEIKEHVEKLSGEKFNSVLINLYRNGSDMVSWHSDNEEELEKKSVIASFSLGASRDFILRRKQTPRTKHKFTLNSGDLFIMKNTCQKLFEHCLPRRSNIKEPRINLTFRKVKPGKQMINEFKGDYAFLSNFYRYPVTLDGVVYPSVENAYQAAKTLDIEQRKAFENVSSSESKRLGRSLKLREDWEEVKIDVMRKLLEEKFSDQLMKELLTNTKPNELVEGNWWGDVVWGVCKGVGQNLLGKLLMEIRDKPSK